MPTKIEPVAVVNFGSALTAFETRLAAVNANWNGQNPDLMTPAQIKDLIASVTELNQASGNLMISAGSLAGNVRA